ncbi:MAG: hypothetical protein F4Y95_00135 [Chloroflexi bacterium]|nr:hypothetical protein [Chloroflexota bacterium]
MDFVHAVWTPAGDGPHPTLIALHGHGAHCQDLVPLAPMLAGGRLQVICPQAEFPLEGAPYSYAPMFTWMKRGANDRPLDGETERVAEALATFIDSACERYNVDGERLALMGFSQGGFLAYRLALSQPHRWQGAAMLSTWLSDEAADDVHPDAADLPLLVQHGTNDPLVGVDRGRNSRDQLQAMRMNLDYREYPMQHEIGRQSMHDLSVWLTDRLLSERSTD